MGRITEVMKAYFEAEGWEGQEPAPGTLVFLFEDEIGHRWACLAAAHEDAEQLAFYSVLLDPAPPERRAEVAEFILRTNCGMQVGNFEMDLDVGEVRFKTSIDVEGTELSRPLCENLVNVNLMITGLYFDGIMSLITGEKRPLEVVGEFETEQPGGDGGDDDASEADDGGEGAAADDAAGDDEGAEGEGAAADDAEDEAGGDASDDEAAAEGDGGDDDADEEGGKVEAD